MATLASALKQIAKLEEQLAKLKLSLSNAAAKELKVEKPKEPKKERKSKKEPCSCPVSTLEKIDGNWVWKCECGLNLQTM